MGNVSDLDPNADLAIMTTSKPVLVTLTSHPVSDARAGNQYIVTVDVTNRDDVRDWAAVVIVEIRDSTGYTVQLNWQSQIIRADESIQLGISWVPTYPDTYQLRTFTMSSLENPRGFTAVFTTEVVVSD